MIDAITDIDCEVVADRAPRPLRMALRLPLGATVADAVQAAYAAWSEPVADVEQARVGLWGELVRPAQVLRDGDRIEIYRELPNDPRSARRARAAARRAGR